MARVDDQVLFSIGEVAAIVGLSRHTIRSWEQRHHLQPRRTASGQRRYTAADVALLLHVKQAVARHHLSLRVAFGAARGELSVPAIQEAGSPSMWRSAADLLSEMMLILDGDGFVRAANLSASTVLGVAPERLPGRHLADLLERSSGRTHVRSLLWQARERPIRFALDMVTISGQRRWTFDCRPIGDDDPTHVVVIAQPG